MRARVCVCILLLQLLFLHLQTIIYVIQPYERLSFRVRMFHEYNGGHFCRVILKNRFIRKTKGLFSDSRGTYIFLVLYCIYSCSRSRCVSSSTNVQLILLRPSVLCLRCKRWNNNNINGKKKWKKKQTLPR